MATTEADLDIDLISPATDLEVRAMRQATAEIVVASSANTNSGQLHFPAADGDGPACEGYMHHHDGVEWLTKDLAVYPRGHREWCQYCTALFRAGAIDDD